MDKYKLEKILEVLADKIIGLEMVIDYNNREIETLRKAAEKKEAANE